MMKSTPASTAQPTCSSNIARTAARRVPRRRVEDVRVADVARRAARRSRCATVAGDLQRLAVDLLERVLLADQPQLLAVGVVGEGLDDVRAGVHELAVQLRHQLRVLEHDLGDERARLQVAAPLELEEVALGADDRALSRAARGIVLMAFSTTTQRCADRNRGASPSCDDSSAPARATSAPASSSRARKRNEGPDTFSAATMRRRSGAREPRRRRVPARAPRPRPRSRAGGLRATRAPSSAEARDGVRPAGVQRDAREQRAQRRRRRGRRAARGRRRCSTPARCGRPSPRPAPRAAAMREQRQHHGPVEHAQVGALAQRTPRARSSTGGAARSSRRSDTSAA